MSSTVAQQIFEPERAKLKPDDTDYDPTYKSTYAFQAGIIPIGKMRIRQ